MRALMWTFRSLEFATTVVGVVVCMGAVERWGWTGLLVLLPAGLVGAGFRWCALRSKAALSR